MNDMRPSQQAKKQVSTDSCVFSAVSTLVFSSNFDDEEGSHFLFYSRWEGGTLLLQIRGEWFNAFSCLMAFSNSSPEKQDALYGFRQRKLGPLGSCCVAWENEVNVYSICSATWAGLQLRVALSPFCVGGNSRAFCGCSSAWHRLQSSKR